MYIAWPSPLVNPVKRLAVVVLEKLVAVMLEKTT